MGLSQSRIDPPSLMLFFVPLKFASVLAAPASIGNLWASHLNVKSSFPFVEVGLHYPP